MPCVIKPGMFLITPLSFLLPNPHSPQTPSLACLPEIVHCFSNVTELNSDGPIKALVHTAETPLGIIAHYSDFIKRAEPVFYLALYLFYLWKNTIVYLGNKKITSWKGCYLVYKILFWAAQTYRYWMLCRSSLQHQEQGWEVVSGDFELSQNASKSPALYPMPGYPPLSFVSSNLP